MTIAEIIRATIDVSPIQFIHECLLGATDVKAKKTAPKYTRIAFATEHMTCNDAFYWSSPQDAPNRKPKYVGVVIWIPYDAYESATKVDALDPVDPNSHGPSTRA